MKNIHLSTLKTSSGFTLVETLVAIAILMIAIAGPLTVAEKGLSASIYARNQLMASYLAQEGIEYMRNIVDTNQLIIHQSQNTNSIDWLNNPNPSGNVLELSQCLPGSQGSPCTIDTINNNIKNCTTSQFCDPLTLGSAGYVQGASVVANEGTVFTRSVSLQWFDFNSTPSDCTPMKACPAVNVVVTVTWPGGLTGAGGVMLEDTLYNTPIQ